MEKSIVVSMRYLECHAQTRPQTQVSSIVVALAASFGSTMMPSCCFPIPLAPLQVAVTASDLVRVSKQTRGRMILAVAAASDIVVAAEIVAAGDPNSGSD